MQRDAVVQILDYQFSCAEQLASRLITTVCMRDMIRAFRIPLRSVSGIGHTVICGLCSVALWCSAALNLDCTDSSASDSVQLSGGEASEGAFDNHIKELIASLVAIQCPDGGYDGWFILAETRCG